MTNTAPATYTSPIKNDGFNTMDRTDLPVGLHQSPQTREEIMSNMTTIYNAKYSLNMIPYVLNTFVAMNLLINEQYNGNVEEFFQDHAIGQMYACMIYSTRYNLSLGNPNLELSPALEDFLETHANTSKSQIVSHILNWNNQTEQ